MRTKTQNILMISKFSVLMDGTGKAKAIHFSMLDANAPANRHQATSLRLQENGLGLAAGHRG